MKLAMKIFGGFLCSIGLAFGSLAAAQSTSCSVKDGYESIHKGQVVAYGDLKIKLVDVVKGSQQTETLIDMKAPGFEQRNVSFTANNESKKFAICGSEVTLTRTEADAAYPGMSLRVSVF